MNPRAAPSFALAFALLIGGCHGCHDSHPYVPYSVDSTPLPLRPLDAGPVTRSTGQPDASAAAFANEPAVLAPPGLAAWPIDGVVLKAPEGGVFVWGVVRDFDGDGAKDAFAIVRAGDGGVSDELVYYRGRADGAPLEGIKSFAAPPIASDATCESIDRLTVVGSRSVLVEMGAACAARAPSAPARYVALVRGGADPAVRLAVTIADPPGAGVLSVDADTADRDGDGLEDLALRISLQGGAASAERGPRVSAIFAWFDRSAGLGRDLSATEASFAALATAAAARASRAREASAVPVFAAQVRALWRAACAEAGAPRVVGVAGTGDLMCGAASAVESVGFAEAKAYATAGDSLRCALAFDRASRSLASRPGSRVAEAQKWIARIAPAASALSIRSVAAVPIIAAGREPAWGSLAFEASGRLLVRTRAGVVRVDPEAGDEAGADGVADWKAAVTSADGTIRWVETYDPCDATVLHATFAPTAGGDLRDVALPVAPPLGDRCNGSRGALARVRPIAWGPVGIEAIVEDEPLLVYGDLSRASPLAGFLGQPTTPGAPRSPDGSTLVLSTGLGLLVYAPSRVRLLRAHELEGTYAEQQDCAVSNDGARVACVHAGRVWVGMWPP